MGATVHLLWEGRQLLERSGAQGWGHGTRGWRLGWGLRVEAGGTGLRVGGWGWGHRTGGWGWG